MSADDLADWARDTLGHAFAEPGLLRRALTHSSVGPGGAGGGGSYQRLEFLGDRVLGCVVAAWLYRDYDEPEGRLTARYHGLVEGPACAEVARALGVPDKLFMEKTVRAKGLGHSDNVLGDIAEAIVAADLPRRRVRRGGGVRPRALGQVARRRTAAARRSQVAAAGMGADAQPAGPDL